ncbi:MAG TPA: glycosyl hydrolase family 18 protein [Methylomusa anaerophila]|uniref:Putative sporulation-specific glycosylase YdhD n=1 Tax=Methylomusa anaerophila TaxID=1930071 RepID=A0A348AFX9_9FIRM|nr:glycosyl hydrolase family 18 protein [Methylomusa anaerophila]BBB89977.1 putative sporulation-specific glycosylase YdhD [Methylomusa anaerophila]HML88295.1 glycosyl hydrolase family 18 protein [Methylomusa anaerophila]
MTTFCIQTPEVLAYYLGNERSGLRYQYLQQFSPWITYLAIVNYTVNETGNLQGSTDPEFLAEVLNLGISPLVVPQNFTGTTFSSAVIHRILTNPQAQQNFIDNLLSILHRYPYHGWNLDIEAVSPQDRDRFSQFSRRLLAWARTEPYLASTAIEAQTPGQHSGHDYRALAKANDFLMIMAYDEHWAGGEPGPIASIPWIKSVIQNALSQVPASQIILGIPLYGLDWQVPIQRGKLATPISFREAMALAEKYDSDINWSSEAKEPYFSYKKSGRQHIVWFQNPRSWAAKLNLVFKYNLRGIGLWEMENADPEFWNTLKKIKVHSN